MVGLARVHEIIGTWRSINHSTRDGARIIEDERWEFPRGAPATARYQRIVTVSSLSGAPFACNQRPQYQLITNFELSVDRSAAPLVARETSYEALPSPCDHGLRQLGSYAVFNQGGHLVALHGGQQQTLWPSTTPPRPAPVPSLAGVWTRTLVSEDTSGATYTEHELWRFAPGKFESADTATTPEPDTTPPQAPAAPAPSAPVPAAPGAPAETPPPAPQLAANDPLAAPVALRADYRRDVIVDLPAGTSRPCAAGASYHTTEWVQLGPRRAPAANIYGLRETAVSVIPHPCDGEDARALDELTLQQFGDELVLEWRGKRRTVLRRQPR